MSNKEQVQPNNPRDQAQQAAQEASRQKINNKVNAKNTDDDFKTNLATLRRLVSQASPIVENKEVSQVTKDANGKEIDTPVNQKVTTGYNYYHVDGKPIEQWVQETFGGKVTLDKEKREIKVNDGADKTPEAKK
jgi:hypothetical protein